MFTRICCSSFIYSWLILSSLLRISFLGDSSALPPTQHVSVANFTPYPYSRGHIHVTGSTLDDPQDFEVAYFADRDDIDVKKHLWAYKKQRQIMRRTKMFRGELAIGHPRFSEGSAAACIEDSDGLLAPELHDVKYTAEDDAAIIKWAYDNVGTTWHSMSTCKMAPLDEKGAVDSSLSVYGVTGLKIADLSICPENVAANTANTAMLVGEKAADIFIRELGLSPV